MKPQAWMIAAAAALLLLVQLGEPDLWAPDEPRYGQIAEELRSLEHGATGAILLHLDGVPYTQKPPLYFWLAALAGVPGGRVGEAAARLPSALAGIAVVWLVVRWGAAALGKWTGWLGAALLLTSVEFARVARRAQLDVLLTLFEVAALAAFWQIRADPRRRKRWIAVLHGAMGLAVLTKGPVGVLVPLLVIAAHLAWERRLRELPALLPPWALALSLGPGLAWLAVAAALAPPGFLEEAVGSNLLGRFFAGTSHARPFFYYLVQLPLNALPWTLLWPAVVWSARRGAFTDAADPRAPARRFLVAWIAATFVFFSISAGKRGLYLLPCFPALALLCADAVEQLRREHREWPRWVTAVGAASLFAVALAGPAARDLASDVEIRIPWALTLAPAAIAVAVLVALRRATPVADPWRVRLVIGICAAWALEWVVFTGFLPRIDPEKSPRPIARAAAALTPPGLPVGLAGKRTLVGGLAYYGDREVRFLETAAEVERFFAAGGHALVVQEKDLARFTGPGTAQVHARSRHGRRTLVVAAPPR